MRIVLQEKRAAYAQKHAMSIEDVPEYEVKTPLQRVVQLLKRHRDIHFQDDLANRPVSIIITTLAAQAYANQEDLFEALTSVVKDMRSFIEQRDNGKWWVAPTQLMPMKTSQTGGTSMPSVERRSLPGLNRLKRIFRLLQKQKLSRNRPERYRQSLVKTLWHWQQTALVSNWAQR
jgi:hypothetical protein